MHESASKDMDSRRLRWWAVLLFCLAVALLAHGAGLSGELLNFDDNLTVQGNPAFAGSSPDFVRIWSPGFRVADVYLPVTYSSLGLDILLFGGAPLAFHLHNLLLWALAACFLVFLFDRLGLRPTLALLASLPFLAHPAMVECVAWVSSRKEALLALFSFSCLWIGRRYVEGARGLFVLPLLAVLACYSKGSGLILPLLAAVLWWVQGRRPVNRRRYVWALLATLIPALAITAQHYFAARAAGTMNFESSPNVLPGVLLKYLELLLVPIRLAVHHPREATLAALSEGAAAKALLLAAVGLVLVALAVRRRSAVRTVAIGLLLLLLGLLPFNGYKPATALPVADRYLILAMPGFGLAIAGAVTALRHKRAASIALVLCGLVWVPWSMLRSRDFQNSETLWSSNLEVYPQDVVALTNLAEYRIRVGGPRLADTKALLERAASQARYPAHKLRISAQRLALALRRGDRLEILKAARDHSALCDALPDRTPGIERLRSDARLQWASLLLEQGRFLEARRLLVRVLARGRQQLDALGMTASCILRETGKRSNAERLAEAAPLFELGDRLAKTTRSYAYEIARIERLFLSGELKALGAVRKLRQDPQWGARPRVFALAADIFLDRGLAKDAMRELEEGLERVPGSVLLWSKLAQVRYGMRQYEGAVRAARQAQRLRPEDESLKRSLARCLIDYVRQVAPLQEPGAWAPLVAEARRLAPDARYLPYLEARVAFSKKQLGKALKLARFASEKEPKDPELSRLLLDVLAANGYAHVLRKQRAKGLAFFTEVLSLAGPDYPTGAMRTMLDSEFRARFETGKTAARQASWAKAEREFRKAISLYPATIAPFPDLVDAIGHLGTALANQGSWVEAAEQFRRLVDSLETLAMDPGKAVLYLSRALVGAGKKREARKLLDRYLKGDRRSKLQNEDWRKRLQAARRELRND